MAFTLEYFQLVVVARLTWSNPCLQMVGDPEASLFMQDTSLTTSSACAERN